ncbi:MAG: hypothetical protein JWQ07_2785 [Ramlibacter sp.]|nr:hypothetical protein [Ramlibacter sp.]
MTRWLLALLLAFLAAGCASPPRATPTADGAAGPWSGRMALQVEGNQSQSFSAGFELKGNAQAGELTLSSPLGGTLAVLAWAPGSATLRSGGQTREFESVDALVAHATGSAIPVAALFDWLRGTPTAVAGWQADLSLLGQGRLAARRTEPPPVADLRVALDR